MTIARFGCAAVAPLIAAERFALNFCPAHMREVDGEKMCRSCEAEMIKEGQVSA